ncbi:MAG TPA: hypothetical protein VFL04_00565 [Rectinemataceae bacterium]|nr:hypothetical protein [Rectinemataceae bacterium]
MKHPIVRLFLCLIAAAPALAQGFTYIAPKDAKAMGLGGSFSALSSGFSSFYGNPAGFASPSADFTVLDLAAWAYFKPTSANTSRLLRIIQGKNTESQTVSSVNDMLIENGFGGGAMAGLGYTGKGVGLGFFAVTDNYASGDTIMGVRMTSSTSVNAVIGLGTPIRIGDLKLAIGGDARPFYRIDSSPGGWSLLDLITGSGNVMDNPVTAGFGLAMDFGASLDLEPFSFGLSIRDISPSFMMDSTTLGSVGSSVSGGGLALPESSATRAQPLPIVSVGASWKPRLVRHFIDPSLYVEVQDPVGIYKRQESAWSLLHVGAELRFLNFITARAGINKGWLSAGLGLDLYVLRLDGAVFTEELGLHPGDRPRTGVVLQAAIRF